MFELAELVLMGTVIKTAARKWERDDRSGVLETCTLVGEGGVFEVLLPRELASVISKGDTVALSVRCGQLYQGRQQMTALGLWDGVIPDVTASAA